MAKTNVIFLTRRDTIVGCSATFKKLERAGNFDNSKSLYYLALRPILNKTDPSPPRKILICISTILITSSVIKLEVALTYEFFSSFFGPQRKLDEATEVKTFVLTSARAGLCEDNRRTQTH
jgi:hypothetical protein